MKKNIFFSIILPTFNREKKILRAINSVIDQSYNNWELIIIDNKSNDRTRELVANLKCEKIFFYEIENDGVIAKSRNLGIDKSKGNYLCFLDSDDWWDRDKLKYVCDKAINGYSFIYHNHYIYSPKNFLKKRRIFCRNLKKPILDDLIDNGPDFATSSVVVNKDIFKKISNFNINKNYIAWEDWDAWLKFSKIDQSFCRINKTLSTVMNDGTNLLDNELRIKNINFFTNEYLINSKNIPNWCLYSLLVSQFNLSLINETKLTLKKIKFFKLSLIQKLNLIKIFTYCFFK